MPGSWKCWALGHTTFRKWEALTLTVSKEKVQEKSAAICTFRTDPVGQSWYFPPNVSMRNMTVRLFHGGDPMNGRFLLRWMRWQSRSFGSLLEIVIVLLCHSWIIGCKCRSNVCDISVFTLIWARLRICE